MAKKLFFNFLATLVAVCLVGMAWSCSDDEDEVLNDPDDNPEIVEPEPDPEPEPEPEPGTGEDEDEDEDEDVDDGVVKILCIGNSFSRDAVEQNLYELFDAAGIESVIGNLYISGCTLETHYNNTLTNEPAYSYRKVVKGNKTTSENYSMLNGIKNENWDYISLQQASPQSGLYDTYNPYLPDLIEYVQSNATNKNMKIVFHQTWAYGKDYNSSNFAPYSYNQMTMYGMINEAVQQAVEDNPAIEIVVPSGTAVQNARNTWMGDTFNSDGRHLETTYGRYTAACAWFEELSGIDVTTTSYAPSGVSSEVKDLVTYAAHRAVQNPYEVDWMEDYDGGDPYAEDEDSGVIYVTQLDSCPTTITASWNVDGCVDDVAKDYPYTVELYKNEACTDLQVRWVIPAESDNSDGLWKPGSTARVYFTFAGLEPSTDYWLTICDTDDETICTKEPVKVSTTAAFATAVTATENAAVGDVILVQDFDKLIHGGDSANKAGNVEPDTDHRSTLLALEGDNPDNFEFVHYNTTGFSPFPLSATGVGLAYTQAVGLGDWCCGKSSKGTSVRTRPGFIQLGSKSSSAYLGYIGTPVLSAIPEGKTATVNVQFKARPFKYGSTYYCQTMSVAVADNVTITSDTLQVSDWGTSKDSGTYVENKQISLTQEDEWTDYTVELTGVTNTSRIRFASVETSKAQVLLDNIVITITALE